MTSKGSLAAGGDTDFSQPVSVVPNELAKLKRRRISPDLERLFPVLSQFAVSLDWKVTFFGLLVEFIQFLGLTLNPRFPWGPFMGTQISKVVYFFDFPLYDSQWAANTFIPANIFFALFNLLMASWLGSLIWFASKDFHRIAKLANTACKIMGHGVTSYGTMPIGLLVASFTVCKPDLAVMFWYDSQTCMVKFGGYALAFGIIGLVLLAAALYISAAFLFEDMPDSEAMGARPDPMITGSTQATKYIAIILFHTLVASGHQHVFAICMTVLFAVQAALYIVYLPYYELRMNQFRAAQMLGVAGFTMVSAFGVPATSAFHTKSISTALAIVLLVAGTIAGFLLARIRVNDVCLKNLSSGGFGRRVASVETPLTYPAYLPENDLVLSKYPNIEAVVRGQTTKKAHSHAGSRSQTQRQNLLALEDEDQSEESGSDDGNSTDHETDDISVLDPYITKTYFPSDVEVATRFLREYVRRSCSNGEPTPRMCVLAARIFTKGLVKYRHDPAIVFQFCVFLTTYAKRLHVSLAEITTLQSDQFRALTSLPLKYRMFRLSERLNRSLNVSNQLQIYFLSVTSELHKDVLTAISSFWGSLISGNQNSGPLADLADNITAKRENCKRIYRRSLQTPNESILLRYAQFLRDVMLDSDSADLLRERVAEEAEQYRQQRRRRKESSHRGSTNNNSHLSTNWDLSKMVVSENRPAAGGFTEGDRFAHGVNEIMKLRIIVYGGSLFVGLLAFALILFGLIRMSVLRTMIQRISTASDVRLYTAIGGIFAAQLKSIALAPTPPTGTDVIIAYIKSELLRYSALVEEAHYRLTSGDLYTSDTLITNYMSEKRVMVVLPGRWSMEGNQRRVLDDLYTVGNQIAAQLKALATAPGTTIPDYPLEYIIVNNEEENFSRAFNRSVVLYVQQRQLYLSQTKWVLLVFVITAITVLIGLYCIVQVYLRRIEVNKVSTLNLFSLIPRSYLREFYQESRERIRRFDMDTDLDSWKPSNSRSGRRHLNEHGPSSATGHPNDLDSSGGPSNIPKESPSELLKAQLNAINRKHTAASPSDEEVDAQRIDEHGYDEVDYVTHEVQPRWNLFRAITGLFARPAVIVCLMTLCAILSIAAFGTTYKLYAGTTTFHQESDHLKANRELSREYYDFMSSLGDFAQQYVLTGDTVHAERYYNTMLNDGEWFSFGEMDQPTESMQDIVDIRTIMESAKLRQQVAMWLASGKYSIPGSQDGIFSRIFAVERPYNFTAMQSYVDAAFGPYAPKTVTPMASTTATDAALPADVKLAVAKNLVFDDVYSYHRYLMAKHVGVLGVEQRPAYDRAYNLQKGLCTASLIMESIMVALFLVVLFGYHFQRSGLWTRVGPVIAVALTLTSIVMLVISKEILADTGNIDSAHMKYVMAVNDTFIKIDANHEYALRMSLYKDPSTQDQWATTSGRDAFTKSVVNLLGAYIEGSRLKEKIDPVSLAKTASTLLASLEQILFFSGITAFLSNNANGFPASPKLENFNYDRTLDMNFEREFMNFGENPSYYSNSANDLTKTVDQQLDIAKTAVSSERYEFMVRPSIGTVEDSTLSIGATITEKRKAYLEQSHQLVFLIMIFGCLILAVNVLSFICSVYDVLMHISNMGTLHNRSGSPVLDTKSRGAAGGNKGPTNANGGNNGALQASRTRRQTVRLTLIICITIVILLFGGLLAIGIQIHGFEQRNSLLVSQVRVRDWSMAQCLVQALRMWNSSPLMSSLSPFRLQLLRSTATALAVRQQLYLGDDSRGGLLRTYSKEDVKLFGSPELEWKEYQLCTPPSLEKGYSVTEFTLENMDIMSEMTVRLFSRGPETVVWQLLGLLLLIFDATSVAATTVFRLPFLLVLSPLSAQLDASSALYVDYNSKVSVIYLSIFVVIATVLLIMLLLLVFLVFRKLLKHLEDEEKGTQILLRMIPENVRREVPAIHDFFQTTSVNYDCDIINAACEEQQQSIIVVNSDDTILWASQETLRLFQRNDSEIIGHKVEVLLSDERGAVIAAHRKQYGVSRLLLLTGKQVRSIGKRMDRTRFSLDIFVREVVGVNEGARSSQNSVYVVRVNAAGIKYDLKMVRHFQRTIFDASPQAQIVTDPKGIIRAINRAALTLLGFEKEDLLGRDMTVMMPDQVSFSHPHYMERYVDQANKLHDGFPSTRRVTARKKDKTELHLDLHVAAVMGVSANPGANQPTVSYLVAHISDASDSIEELHTATVIKCIIDTSPIPIVLFDKKSNIVTFSPAAERSWRCKANEVIGFPLRNLLHGADAANYDFTYGPRSGLKHFLDTSRTLEARRMTGEHFLVEVTMRELRNGDSLTILAYFRDLSPEQTIVQRNLASQSTYDGCPIPIIVADEQGIVVTVNPAAERQFGYPARNFVGENVTLIMPDNIAMRHNSYLRRFKETGIGSVIGETRQEYAKRADGRLFTVEIQVRELFVDIPDSTERRHLYVAYLRDTSAEYQMRRANDVQSAITHRCPVPIVSIDKHGTILSFNPAAEELFNYEARAVIGCNVRVLMPERFAAKHDEYLANYFRTGKCTMVDSTSEVFARTANGQEVPIELKVRAVQKDLVDPIFVSSMLDISAKVQLEKAHEIEEAFINSYPISIIVINARGTIHFLSDPATKLFGYPPDSPGPLGSHVASLIATRGQEDHLVLKSLLNLDTPSRPTQDVQCRRIDQSCFAARISVAKLSTENDTISDRSSLKPQREADSTASPPSNSSIDAEDYYSVFIQDLATECALRQSGPVKERLLGEVMKVSAVEIDSTGTINSVNDHFLQAFGYSSRSDVVGKNISIIIPNKQVAHDHTKSIQRYLHSSTRAFCLCRAQEVDAMHADGTTIHVKLTVGEIVDDKQVFSFLGLMSSTDDTVRTHSHQRLMSQVWMTSPISAFLLSYDSPLDSNDTPSYQDTAQPDGSIYAVNPAAIALFRHSADLVGQPIHTVVMTATPPIEEYRRMLEGSDSPAGLVVTMLGTGIRRDGTTFPTRLSLTSFYDSETGRWALVAFLEERTLKEQQQLEHRLSRSIVGVMPFAVVCTDEEGRILLFNEQAEKMFGTTEAEMLTKPITRLMIPRTADSFNDFMQSYVHGSDRYLRMQAKTFYRQIAVRHSEEVFPVEITMYEASGDQATPTSPSEPRLFVFNIRDTSQVSTDAITGQISKVALSMMGIPFMLLNEMGVMEIVNEALVQMMGMTQNELLGHNVKALFPPDVARRLNDVLQRLKTEGLAGGVVHLTNVMYVPAKHRDGTSLALEVHLTYHHSPELNQTNFQCFLRSVKDLVELKKEEAINEVLADAEGVGVLLFNARGIITHASITAHSLFGYQVMSDPLENCQLGRILPIAAVFESLTNGFQAAQSAMDDPAQKFVSLRVEGKALDGTRLFCKLQMREATQNSTEVSYLGIVKDVPRHTATADRILMLQEIERLSLIGVICCGVDSIISYANERSAHIFGYDHPNELIGQNLRVCLPPSEAMDHHLYLENYAKGFKGHSVIGILRRLRGSRKDRTSVQINLTLEEYQSTTRGHQFISFIEELSATSSAESEKAAQVLLAVTPIVTFLIEDDGTVLQVSQAAVNALETRKEAILGRNVGNFFRNLSTGAPLRTVQPGAILVTAVTATGAIHQATLSVTVLTEKDVGRTLLCMALDWE